jgi:hypothetical protein
MAGAELAAAAERIPAVKAGFLRNSDGLRLGADRLFVRLKAAIEPLANPLQD